MPQGGAHRVNGRSIEALRVVDLKVELESRGLSKSGAKKDLLHRLTKHLDAHPEAHEDEDPAEGESGAGVPPPPEGSHLPSMGAIEKELSGNDLVQDYLALRQSQFESACISQAAEKQAESTPVAEEAAAPPITVPPPSAPKLASEQSSGIDASPGPAPVNSPQATEATTHDSQTASSPPAEVAPKAEPVRPEQSQAEEKQQQSKTEAKTQAESATTTTTMQAPAPQAADAASSPERVATDVPVLANKVEPRLKEEKLEVPSPPVASPEAVKLEADAARALAPVAKTEPHPPTPALCKEEQTLVPPPATLCKAESEAEVVQPPKVEPTGSAPLPRAGPKEASPKAETTQASALPKAEPTEASASPPAEPSRATASPPAGPPQVSASPPAGPSQVSPQPVDEDDPTSKAEPEAEIEMGLAESDQIHEDTPAEADKSRGPEASAPAESQANPTPAPAETPVSTSKVVFITNLVRPYTLNQLKDLLSRTGTFDTSTDFWIDKIKSKCVVRFAAPEQAAETVAALHGVSWPTSNPKALVVQLSSEEEFQRWSSGNAASGGAAPPNAQREARLQRTAFPPADSALANLDRKRKISEDTTSKTPAETGVDAKKAKPLDELFTKTKFHPSLYWKRNGVAN